MCDKIIFDSGCNTIVLDEPFVEGFVQVYVLQLNRTNDRTTTQVIIRENPEDDIIFTIGEDGYYTLCKILVPTNPTSMYYYKDGVFYKNIEEVELDELINTNPEVSKLNITYYYYFQLCKLRKCYVKSALKILNNKLISCNNNTFSQDIYIRDLLLSVINSIMYLVETDNFEEAERLLERVSGCNGLCDNIEYNCNCGCED